MGGQAATRMTQTVRPRGPDAKEGGGEGGGNSLCVWWWGEERECCTPSFRASVFVKNLKQHSHIAQVKAGQAHVHDRVEFLGSFRPLSKHTLMPRVESMPLDRYTVSQTAAGYSGSRAEASEAKMTRIRTQAPNIHRSFAYILCSTSERALRWPP